ncbi:MAG: GTPase HflX [Oligoflexia bacterium]|nr:GTPase HflX [Oligoflexia bacterium]
MLENEDSLLPRAARSTDGGSVRSLSEGALRAVSVGLEEESLNEMARLLTTLGVKPVGRVLTPQRKIHAATYIGKGKIEEVKALADELQADSVILDVELTPNQLRNLEVEFGRPILDRPGVIIEIFSRHARTKEAKTQVALARLQYLLPRLSHFWAHFERQRGGGVGNRGMGEKQIEVDRRLIKKRISVLRERLVSIRKERQVQRAGRKDVLKVAIVGYTNAGKSTLLNALTQSAVRAEDKLFATLDASVRSLDPNCHPPVVAIDTVGFINKLPTSLIASFRSTLEELEDADLLLHVVDASSAQAAEQLEVTEGVLKELRVDDKPRMMVLNKADQLKTPAEKNNARLLARGGMMVSALDREDMVKLRERVLDHFKKNLELYEVVIPYANSRLEAMIHAHGSVEVTRHLEKGTFYRLRIEEGWAQKLGLEKFRL